MPALLFPVGAVQVQTTGTGPTSYTHQYSGIVVNQNAIPEMNTDWVAASATYLYQTFVLPSNYERDNSIIPSLTGFQVYLGIDSGMAATAALSWTLDHYIVGVGWVNMGQATATGSPLDGNELWMTVYFPQPLPIEQEWLGDRYRIGVQGQAGINRFWYSVPNPLAATSDKLYSGGMTLPVLDSGREVSLMFRVLGDVADEGVDFLGNTYRSAVVRNEVGSITTGPGSDRDSYYLSAPQPSKFAVVSHYFDMRDTASQAVVVDGMMVDPITPGVWFNVYYSNDATPGFDPDSWDNLLWTPIPQSYQLTSRTNYMFPKPITAKYIKVEYSHLQAKSYAPGDFQKPIVYKKHPKWVTDYFLARILDRNTEDPFTARRVEVIYDALDFAFNYYRADLSSTPDTPSLSTITAALNTEDVGLTGVDQQTLSRIRLAFQPYLNEPALTGRSDYILGSFLATLPSTPYPVEEIDRSRADVEEVSSLEREGVIVEKSYPVMFFFVTCRHAYRVAAALFPQDRAYFVGINEIAFTRERYDSRSDTSLYIESAGDLVNVQRNDFASVDFKWVVYRDH